jgi:hypothetical protein
VVSLCTIDSLPALQNYCKVPSGGIAARFSCAAQLNAQDPTLF